MLLAAEEVNWKTSLFTVVSFSVCKIMGVTCNNVDAEIANSTVGISGMFQNYLENFDHKV